MEMNVSTQEEQVVAKKAGGLNPAIVLPILYLIALGIYIFVLGNPGNFALWIEQNFSSEYQ